MNSYYGQTNSVCEVHHNPPDCRMRLERATCRQGLNLLTVPALCPQAPLPTHKQTKIDHMMKVYSVV